jgi:hypothetical protein
MDTIDVIELCKEVSGGGSVCVGRKHWYYGESGESRTTFDVTMFQSGICTVCARGSGDTPLEAANACIRQYCEMFKND